LKANSYQEVMLLHIIEHSGMRAAWCVRGKNDTIPLTSNRYAHCVLNPATFLQKNRWFYRICCHRFFVGSPDEVSKVINRAQYLTNRSEFRTFSERDN
jgi:hypothetical protein